MRIHTNTLTANDIQELVRKVRENTPGAPRFGVNIADLSQHGSRSHARSFDLYLSGSANRPQQGGKRNGNAATWDEWGNVLAALYDTDAQMVCGSIKRPIYSGWGDFHRKTCFRFTETVPVNVQHLQHHWDFVSPGFFRCKCGAGRSWQLTA